jgi:hypothetical protein
MIEKGPFSKKKISVCIISPGTSNFTAGKVKRKNNHALKSVFLF